MKTPEQIEKKRIYDRQYRAKNLEKMRSQEKAYREKNADQLRVKKRLGRYGLNPESFKELFESQGGLCALCRVREVQHIDHCHKTGKVRGLLCHNCNVGLGHFQDSEELLLAAIEYLKR